MFETTYECALRSVLVIIDKIISVSCVISLDLFHFFNLPLKSFAFDKWNFSYDPTMQMSFVYISDIWS